MMIRSFDYRYEYPVPDTDHTWCEVVGIPSEFRAAPPKKWIPAILWGMPGSSKSYRAVQRLKDGKRLYAVQRRKTSGAGLQCEISARWVNVPGVMGAMRADYKQVETLKNGCKWAFPLVLDDFGAGKDSGFTLGELYEIIEHRVNEEMPTPLLRT